MIGIAFLFVCLLASKQKRRHLKDFLLVPSGWGQKYVPKFNKQEKHMW